jgi:hypothetical protein
MATNSTIAGNATSGEYFGWRYVSMAYCIALVSITKVAARPNPDGRGTWEILKSCLITLVLSVYTALHLNLPPGNAGSSYMYLRKVKWVLIGMFAPEVVIYTAWAQREKVKKLSTDLAVIFENLVCHSILPSSENENLKDYTIGKV